MESRVTNTAIGDKKIFLAMVAGIMLSAFDGVATVQHITHGVASEANPVMQYLLQHGVLIFFFTKLAITVGSLLFCYASRTRALGRAAILISIVFYCLLLLYHLAIFKVAYVS